MYEYFHHEDITALADVHKSMLLSTDAMTTQLYRFRTRSGSYIKLLSSWKAFRNPWTRETECIIAKNTLAP
jgi:aryl hydrocarbon receptor nuclear translocator-like protein 1